MSTSMACRSNKRPRAPVAEPEDEAMTSRVAKPEDAMSHSMLPEMSAMKAGSPVKPRWIDGIGNRAVGELR